MLSHFEEKYLPYSREKMFALVAAVDQYKEFAPWCVASRIKKWEGDDVFLADLIVGYKVFREKFSSRVFLKEPDEIYIEYQEGPLKNLKNKWVFKEADDGGCLIEFSVEFEFKNAALQTLANLFFTEVVKRMVSAFEARAIELYGAPNSSGSPQSA
ncbi:MAG: type II toxin-antitoxin system RatA family toxin [Pseudomonadota bacterium]